MRNKVIVEKVGRTDGNGHQKDNKLECDQVKSLLMAEEKGVVDQDGYPENNMGQHPDGRIFEYFW